VAGPVKWTERWIARAQRKADLRDERFRRHQQGVRAGTEPPSLMDRLEAGNTRAMERFETRGVASLALANERRINRGPLAARSYGSSLAEAWRTWVTDGPVRGPDGVEVRIWVRYADQDLPFHDRPDYQPCPTWQELDESRKVYTVCVRPTLDPPVPISLASCFSGIGTGARSYAVDFATEISARWYAVEFAWIVRRAGITGLEPSDIFPERPRRRSARLERVVAEEIIGIRSRSGHDMLGLPRRARGRWRQVRTGRR
jgi:hypothetical protein